MRRLLAIFCAAVVACSILVVATGAAGAHVSHSKTTGFVAHAFWTTFPADGNPEPGVVYTNTAVSAVDIVFQNGSMRVPWRTVLVDEFRFSYDEVGNFVPLLAINGRVGEPATFTLSIARDLTSAFAQATVRQTVCTPTPDSGLGPRSFAICGGAWDPRDGGTAPLTVTWAATGERLSTRANSVDNLPPCFTVVRRTGDVQRPAAVSASFDGRDLGVTPFAVMLELRHGDMFVEHLPQSPHDPCAPPPPPAP